MNGRLGEATLVFSSSGHSGAFSFGLETRAQSASLARRLDLLFDYYFGIATERSLLVNALPGSVRVPSRHAVVAELGARPGAVVRALRDLAPEFEQIVLVGEPLLIKAVIDEAADAALRLDRRRVHVVSGGDFLPQSFREYIARHLAHDLRDPDAGQVVTSYGVSELGLSLAHDTPELRAITRAFDGDPGLCEAVMGRVPHAPTLLQALPDQYYLETPLAGARPRIVATTLDPSRPLPLVRYDTGDEGELVPHERLARRLTDAGRAALVPSSRWPLVALWGRGGSIVLGERCVHVEQVKAALYDDIEVAAALSGRFRLEQAAGVPRVRLERRRPHSPVSRALEQRLLEALSRRTAVAFELAWEEPESPCFVRGYERKQRYLA